MRIEFRIDFGYQLVYSRRHYHPVFCWDGNIESRGGKIISVSQLKYPFTMFGVVHSAEETPLPANSWTCTTRRGMAGIGIVAEGEETTEFTVTTASGTFHFTGNQVLHDGRIVFPFGGKFSFCTAIVTRKGYLWFRPAPLPMETVVDPQNFTNVEVVERARMTHAWINPQSHAEFEITLSSFAGEGERSWLVHLQVMTARKPGRPEIQASDYMPIALYQDSKPLASIRYYLRSHDLEQVQMLHDVWMQVPFASLAPGAHPLRLVNQHSQLPLLVNRLSIRPRSRCHLDLQHPRWSLVGREFILGVHLLEGDSVLEFDFDSKTFQPLTTATTKALPRGFHEFQFIPLVPQIDARIGVRDKKTGKINTACIGAVYDLCFESPEIKVGYDMTSVPHDESGEMDWLLDYTQRTQLGNLVVFRPFSPRPIPPGCVERWGKFCREHGLYVQAVSGYQDGDLAGSSGEYFQGIGAHELTFTTYGMDPDGNTRSMKHAVERFLADMKADVEKNHAFAKTVSYGDAGGGHRYSLLAGADFLRAETMVAHTLQHLSQARAAAVTLGKGEWGVHIAIQHCKQPYLETHLGMYYLSLLQPWMMGATFLYEEDSLFLMFKEERQCWDDLLTKGKRDMTRDFFRFAFTHPRKGRPDISIALLLGRYAAPFNGFICGSEQGPWYSVWGKYGRNDPTWAHLQPEKGHQIMDVLMPGASTHPFRQRYDRRRFYFSGTPYGDFDQLPVEASDEFFSRYRLMLHLAWNTMIDTDYAKLKRYVEAGGALLLGVPQLSTHENRDFLAHMDDLALYRGGDASALCGVKIKGPGPHYCGHWHSVDQAFDEMICPPLSRVPNERPDEDGPCRLAEVELHGARPVVIDAISGKPLLTEYKLGKGCVFLLTAWAYPGHEALSEFTGALVSRLADRFVGPYRVDDPDREVFWTRWPEGTTGCGKLMMLNTDWSQKGNAKTVTVRTPAVEFQIDIHERQACLAAYLPFGVLIPNDPEPHVEIVGADAHSARLKIHATGSHRFDFFTRHPATTAALNGRSLAPIASRPGKWIWQIDWKHTTVADLAIHV